MIYRRTPPQPPRLLLRVVAGVGAFAAATSVAACSSSSTQVGEGLTDAGYTQPGSDAGDSSVEGCDACGITVDSGGLMGIADGTSFFPEASTDAGDAGPVGLFGNDSGGGDGGQDQ